MSNDSLLMSNSESATLVGEHALPSFPPLYFAQGVPFTATTGDGTATTPSSEIALPPEVLYMVLDRYCDWGDIARISCVQRAWSRSLYDSALSTPTQLFTLAQAFLHGKSGLAPNPVRAMSLLLVCTNVPIDSISQSPIFNHHQQTRLDQVGTGNPSDFIPVLDSIASDTAPVFVPAVRALSDCFFHGSGTSNGPNSDLGLLWLQAAFIVGHDIDAAYLLALIYERGLYSDQGIAVDVIQAARWFQAAAELGHVEAMAELALCYELGCGVEVSDELAVEWYVKAANAGHVTAKFAVGEAFEEARGVPQSDSEACLWYYKAALAGDGDSIQALRRLSDIARIVIPAVGVLLDV
jgi:hypothetical protein